MTIGRLKFDGDSHTRKADWFGMTRSNGPTNSKFVSVLTKADNLISFPLASLKRNINNFVYETFRGLFLFFSLSKNQRLSDFLLP